MEHTARQSLLRLLPDLLGLLSRLTWYLVTRPLVAPSNSRATPVRPWLCLATRISAFRRRRCVRGSTRRDRRTSPRRRPARSCRSRGSDSCGRLSVRRSTARLSGLGASTGTSSSLASVFSPHAISGKGLTAFCCHRGRARLYAWRTTDAPRSPAPSMPVRKYYFVRRRRLAL